MRQRLIALLTAVLIFGLLPLTAAADWSTPLNLTASAADVTGVSLAVDHAGLVHVVWSAGGSLYHRYQVGGVWSPTSLVASGWEPCLLPDSSAGVHLVYNARPESAQEVLHATWATPLSWSLPSNLSQSDNDSGAPAIAQNAAGDLAVVWSENTASGPLVFVAESSDGAQWSATPLPQAAGTAPQAAFGPDGALTVVWEEVFDLGFPLEIMASTRGNDGWSLPEDVSFTMMSQSQAPTLAANAQGVWLAWEESAGENTAIHAAWLGAEGWSVGAEVALTTDAQLPVLAFDATGYGHLAWLNGQTIAHARLPQGAQTWQAAPNVATSASALSGLALAASDALQVAWLAGEQGANRDAWFSQESGAVDRPFKVRVPLVMR